MTFEEIFDGDEGFVHALDLDGGAETGFRADERVITASIFKIPIVLEYARQAAAGELDPAGRHLVTAEYREGGNGTDGCRDDVELSARDLAFLMMTLSDNAATDALLDLVGRNRVRATLDSLGFQGFDVSGSRELDERVRRELGLPPGTPFGDRPPGTTEDRIRALSILDPAHGPGSTPRQVTALLAAIWRDEAGPPRACAEVRQIMSRQVWQHRMTSGFGEGVAVAGKTGTEWGIRNEAGVVTYPDGRRYAVAVFVRTRSLAARNPAADAVIGTAARAAVDLLRA